jgi:membrane fusion protein, multidrug efflux system
MKTKIFSVFLAIIILAACKPDKQAQLNNLKKQRDQLNEQIQKLESEINASDSTKKDDGIRVTVTEIKPTEFKHFIEVQGKVDGDENVSVTTQSGGLVDQIYVKEGDMVKKDQVLAKLDDKILQQTLKDLISNSEFINSVYEKQKALWDQKIGSEVQYLSAKTNKESMDNKIAALKDQIATFHLTSPINGTVEDISIKIGQMMAPGFLAFRVVNFSKLKIVADLAEAYTQRINNGDRVSIYLPDLKKEVEGKVDFNSKYINPTNRTFQTGVRLSSVDNNLKANMIAVLRINDYSSPNAIVVPINVVQTDQTGTYVVVAEKTSRGNAAKRISIVTGETYKGLIEIKSGLKPGNLLITAGYLELENGQAVSY